MKRLKVMTVVGTRPEIIRLSRVLARLDATTDHVLVHTGQNYDDELNQVFFRELALRPPDHVLGAAGATAIKTIASVLGGMDDLLAAEQPDAFLVLGDTNSSLSAIVAKRHKVPVFHMEAGNRCFDQRVPEEINRKIVDHVSDVNLTYSSIARDYLLREGCPPDRVIKTGSPMFEVLAHYAPQIAQSDVLARLGLTPREYFVVSAHREENVDSPERLGDLIGTLNGLAASQGRRIIFSVHPRTRRRIDEAKVRLDPAIELHKPLGFLDYVKLQQNALCVLSDSGTITEESSILNFPALNIREAHERPEGMEEAAVILSGLRWERVSQCLELALAQPRDAARGLRLVQDYAMPNVSDKVVRLIHSYTDYIRRVVWQESPRR